MTTTMVSKELSHEEKIKTALRTWAGWSDDSKFALDLAAMDVMLLDLDFRRDEIEAAARKLAKDETAKIRKSVMASLARSKANGTLTPGQIRVAKAVLSGEFSKAPDDDGRRVRIEAYTRKDGVEVKEHWRTLPPGMRARVHNESAENYEKRINEAWAEVQEERGAGIRRDQGARIAQDKAVEDAASGMGDIGAIDMTGFRGIIGSIAENVSGFTERVSEGMTAFLGQSTWGRRVIAGAEYLASTGGRLKLAASLMVEYGPFLGMRMAHAYFRYGGYNIEVVEPGKRNELGDKMPNHRDDMDKQRNALVNILRKRLPGSEEADMGKFRAPSEGFVLGPDGEVLHHGVGRGSDHYLPFGLSGLRKLRNAEGGELIRRRVFGGPTVEDLHAGMMLGADKVTVVSLSGVFTVDITPRAQGLKSEHLQILARLTDLLNDTGKNFEGYDDALRTLALEFPLHFRIGDSKPGPQPQNRDVSGPRTTLLDEFRAMFTGENVDDVASANRTGGATTGGDIANWRRHASAAGLPPRANDTIQEWLERHAGDDGKRLQLSRWREAMGLNDRETQRYTPSGGGQARRITPDWKNASEALGSPTRSQGRPPTQAEREEAARDERSRSGPVQTRVAEGDERLEQIRDQVRAELRNERRAAMGIDDLEGPSPGELESIQAESGPISDDDEGAARDFIDMAEDWDALDDRPQWERDL